MNYEKIYNAAMLRLATGSTASKEENVGRIKFQRGSVFKSKAGTIWFGNYSEYERRPDGSIRRKPKQIRLGWVRNSDGSTTTKAQAKRILQPYVDRINASVDKPLLVRKRSSFEDFADLWERDFLPAYKPSTQATMKGHVKLFKRFIKENDLRSFGPPQLQHLIAVLTLVYAAKTVKNMWITLRLIWSAALSHELVDQMLLKPKLPKALRGPAKFFTGMQIMVIMGNSTGEMRTLFWLLAETGIRAGEAAALPIDMSTGVVSVKQSVWNGKAGTPKTQSSIRDIAISLPLAALLFEQVERQQVKGHKFLFTSSTGAPLDMNILRQRKLHPFLDALNIPRMGWHAFRHFNATFMLGNGVPLKTAQERLGHSSFGSLTLDVYTHSDWRQNCEAATVMGRAILELSAEYKRTRNDFVSVSTIKEERLPTGEPGALVETSA